MSDDEVTITVRLDDLYTVLRRADKAGCSPVHERIRAALPWEPSEEQIAVGAKGLGLLPPLSPGDRAWVIARLESLHAAGLVLP